MKCALCEKKDCYQGKDCTEIKEKVLEEYEKEENKRIMQIASGIEAEGYMRLTRLEELIRFCKEMNFKRIGIAFCIGLQDEAKILNNILENDFEVYSACCKVCGIDKERFELKKIKKERYEAMCNPVGQATALNEKETQLNIIFGLCIGHDILFSKYSTSPVTTLLVKDRVLAHNPAGAIYSKYYKSRFDIK